MIKKFNTFNESNTPDTFTITVDDIKKTKHNLGYKRDDPDSFIKNYGWDDTVVLEAEYPTTYQWNGKEVKVYELFKRSQLGYAIKIDGELKYILGIYEPHGCSVNTKRGFLTAHGHEQIINLWLDDGEFDETHTR